MRAYLWMVTFVCVLVMDGVAVHADVPPAPNPALLSIARQFVSRVSQKFDAADRAMGLQTDTRIPLPEGEPLLFNIALPKNIVLDNIVTAEVHNQGLRLSLRDYVAALELPITFDSGHADGWYIRENKPFHLDAAKRSVDTDHGHFTFSKDVSAGADDIMVPVDELGTWFGFTMKPQVSQLQIGLTSPVKLPIEERLARQARKFSDQRLLPPELPLKEDPQTVLAAPLVDVTTQSTYAKNGQTGDTTLSRTANIATAGDFAHGTLVTQSLLNDQDIVSSVRATYRKQRLEPTLLGPLHARQYELGDVTTTSQPLTSSHGGGLGVHVTNADPLRSTLDATTGISGDALPGWDVELYRDNQLLDQQTVGDDGRYNFDKVDLFSSDNNFRIVLYGPQGEVREQTVYVPVDTQRLAQRGSAYDLAVTMNDTQAYRAQPLDTPDKGAPRVNAQYERPIGDESALQLGLEAGQDNGNEKAVLHSGVSTTLAQTLVNIDTAVDTDGEAAADLVTRRNFGEHNLRNTLEVASDHFDDNTTPGTFSTVTAHKVFSDKLSLNGPLPFGPGTRPRYNLSFDYDIDADGNDQTIGSIGMNSALGRVSFNQQFNYTLEDSGNRVDSLTTLSGLVGHNRLRVTSDYGIKPIAGLQNLKASLQRPLTHSVDMELGLARDAEAKTDEVSAQLDWETEHAVITPSLTYNSQGDMTAAINTRFGMLRDPQQGHVHTTARTLTQSGAISVFVFLDKNGNGRQDADEPGIENAMIAAPQNGGRVATNKDGYALLTSLENLRLTDVYIEPDSLQDPYWVPATRGNSILPLQGHVAQMVLPVLMAGDIDGTLYAQSGDGTHMPRANMPVNLYKPDGNRAMSTTTDETGYYTFSPVPPGDYLIMVGDGHSRMNDALRPAPIPVHMGYDGAPVDNKDIAMAAGTDDSPVQVLTSLESLQRDEPQLDAHSLGDRTVILNLGQYKSGLLMGLTWYRARVLQPDAVQGLQTLVPPSESYANIKTGLHTLRIGGAGLNYAEARRRCGALNAGGIKCILEVLPGGLQVARL